MTLIYSALKTFIMCCAAVLALVSCKKSFQNCYTCQDENGNDFDKCASKKEMEKFREETGYFCLEKD